jgi:hypothetical protein
MYNPMNLSHPDVAYLKITDFPASLPMQLLWRRGANSQEIHSFIEYAKKATSITSSRNKAPSKSPRSALPGARRANAS